MVQIASSPPDTSALWIDKNDSALWSLTAVSKQVQDTIVKLKMNDTLEWIQIVMNLRHQNHKKCFNADKRREDVTIALTKGQKKDPSVRSSSHLASKSWSCVHSAHADINFLIRWKTKGHILRKRADGSKGKKIVNEVQPLSTSQNSVWMTNALFALCPATRLDITCSCRRVRDLQSVATC